MRVALCAFLPRQLDNIEHNLGKKSGAHPGMAMLWLGGFVAAALAFMAAAGA